MWDTPELKHYPLPQSMRTSGFERLKNWIKRNAVTLSVSFLVFLWVFVYMFPGIFISIRPGQAGVLWKRLGSGTVTKQYFGEGFHVIWPWDKMYIYDVRYQQITHGVDVLSSDGLQYHIEVTVRFQIRPEKVGLIHKYVGPEYVEKLLIPVVASRIRSEVAKYHPEEVYTSKRRDLEIKISDDLRNPASVALRPNAYIEIADVFIRSIVLPPTIAQAIEAKLVQQQKMLEYTYRIEKEKKERQRKQIEAEGIRLFQGIFNQGVSDSFLKWQGIKATLELAKSNNTKIVVIGSDKGGLPLIFGDGNFLSPKDQTPSQSRNGNAKLHARKRSQCP